jgi:hypothetical protein
VTRVQSRPGEGVLVDLKVVSVNGDTTTSVFDLGSLPAPGRQFTADAAGVSMSPALISLLFAQSQPIGEGVLSLLVVQMSFESINQWLSQINSEFRKKIESLPTYAKLGKLTNFSQKAEQTVFLPASIAFIGYTGGFGAIDFYHSSPFAVGQMALTHKIAVDPVARVHLPTGVLIAIIDRLEALAKSFPNLEAEAK